MSEHDFRVFTQLFKTPVADDAITVLEEAEEEAEEEARKLRTSGASPEPDFNFGQVEPIKFSYDGRFHQVWSIFRHFLILQILAEIMS